MRNPTARTRPERSASASCTTSSPPSSMVATRKIAAFVNGVSTDCGRPAGTMRTLTSTPAGYPVRMGYMNSPASNASAAGLCDFIDASPSPFHVCLTAARRLTAAGFTELTEGAVVAGSGGRLLHGPGRIPGGLAVGSGRGSRRSASSAGTPTVRTCGSSSIRTGSSSGWQVVALEPYGGAWLNSWLDRDLGISGRLSVRSGNAVAGRAGPHRRPDPSGAAAGHPPGRGPQGRRTEPAAPRQRGLGRRHRRPAPSSTTWPSAPTSTRTPCWPPT